MEHEIRTMLEDLRPHLHSLPDHPEWIKHKLTDESWQQWRDENPLTVAALRVTSTNEG